MSYILGMRSALVAVVLLVSSLVGCSGIRVIREPSPKEFAPGAQDPIAPVTTIHCDTAFTKEERASLLAAAELWNVQTSGVARITLVFDVDFESTRDIESHANSQENLMLRLESWMEIVQSEDGEQGALLLGVVSPAGGIHNPWQKPLTVGFVVDRLDGKLSGVTLTQVALHEFGHVLGIPHQPGVAGIMFPSAIKAKDVCLKKSDLVAFCSVNECGTHRMHPCE